MKEAADILSLFESRMRELNMTQVELSQKAFGKADNSAIQSLKKGSVPAYDRVAAMARALDLEIYLGPSRSDPQPLPSVQIDAAVYVPIPLHEALLSAGPGAHNGDISVVDQLVFRVDWLAKMDLLPENGALARITGDSMAPALPHGDLVLIDTVRREVPIRRRNRGGKLGPIYAFLQDGEARVKRIERPEQKILILISDNPLFPPELVTDFRTDNLQILGQVVWSGHVWR